MADEVLQLDDVTVTRGGVNIIDSLTVAMDEGERWVILGPNGAGKTTTITLLAGRLFPSRGTVHLLGETMGRVDVAELHPLIGLCSAKLAERIRDGETALDIVRTAAYGKVGRWREEYEAMDDERAQELLDQMGVGRLAKRRYGTLSSGERKRIEVARALMPDPEVLLLDEPAAGLDLGGREQLLAALTEIAQDVYSPLTVLVTHYVEEIPQGFTHLLLLADGKEVASGPLEQTLTSENLSKAYGMPLQVSRDANGRWHAAAATA